MNETKYVVRYDVVGATGRSRIFDTLAEAEIEAEELHAAFYAVANVWITTQRTASQQNAAPRPPKVGG